MAAARFLLFIVVFALVIYGLYRAVKWGIYYVSERARLAQEKAEIAARKDIAKREAELADDKEELEKSEKKKDE